MGAPAPADILRAAGVHTLGDDPSPEAVAAVLARLRARVADGPDEWPDAPDLPGPPDPDPLPVDVLPPALRAHVESVSGATQTPPELGTMLALAAVSAAVGGAADVMACPRREWRELPVLYTAVVLPSAGRKSPVYRLMVDPLEAWEAERCAELGPAHGAAMARAEDAASEYRHARDARARRRKDAPAPDEVEVLRLRAEDAGAAVPMLPRVLAGDATPEALVRLMAEQGGRLALLAPEADPLGIADGRYSDSARVDELLRAWCGESIRVDRIGREPIHVPRPALTMGLTVQPAALDALRHAEVHRGRGLWGRVLWAAPPHGLGSRLTGADVPALDRTAAGRYAQVLRVLLGATWPAPETPHDLALAAEAEEELWRWEAELEAGLADGGRYAATRDHAGKLAGQAVRLAALLELAARAEDGRPLWSEPVGPWAMGGAVRLARALATHATAVLVGMGADPATEDARYVLRRARELPVGSTLSELRDATRDRPGLETADDLRPVVGDLTARGCIRLVEQGREGPGRPPSPVVELHPALRDDTPLRPPVNPVNPSADVRNGDIRGFRGVNRGEDTRTAAAVAEVLEGPR